MSRFISKVLQQVQKTPDALAMQNTLGETLSYRDLWNQSEKLAEHFLRSEKDKKPVVVYGHKNPPMLISFLACIKSGRAYIPMDVSLPLERANAIIQQLDNPIIIDTLSDKSGKLLLSAPHKILAVNGKGGGAFATGKPRRCGYIKFSERQYVGFW